MLQLNHKNLDVWKLSKDLIKEIYKLTDMFPKNEMYGIVNQMRRASVSILCNIAEGSARKSSIERKRFFEISRSSLVEVDSLFEISLDIRLIKSEDISTHEKLIIEIFKKLTVLIQKT